MRAWRSYDRFEGRSQVSTWLHRIATNVCLTMLEGRQRRARPIELGPSSPLGEATLGPAHPEAFWLQPVPEGRVVPAEGDPARAGGGPGHRAPGLRRRPPAPAAPPAGRAHPPRSPRLARQRGGRPARHVGRLRQQRLAAGPGHHGRTGPVGFRPDADGERGGPGGGRPFPRRLRALRHGRDGRPPGTRTPRCPCPPTPSGCRAPPTSWAGCPVPGHECAGSHVIPVPANGTLAFAQYRPNLSGEGYHPWALQVLETAGGQVTGVNSFLDTEVLFPLFDLPEVPEG